MSLAEKVGSKVVMALDPSTTSTGFSVFRYGCLEECGKWVPPKDKTLEPNELKMERIIWIGDKLSEYIEKYKPDVIFIEAPFIRQPSAAIPLAMLFGHLSRVALPLRLRPVNNLTWKAKLIPKCDKGDKQLFVDYANRKWGLSLQKKDNDIADAVCIMTYALDYEEL